MSCAGWNLRGENGEVVRGNWSRRRESNPHRAKLRQILSLLRLPVPPLRACNESSMNVRNGSKFSTVHRIDLAKTRR